MVNTQKILDEKLKKFFRKKVIFNHPLSKVTTLGIGGPAQYFISARNEKDLLNAIRFAKTNSLPLHLIGGGSNIVANDRGVRGVIIQHSITSLQINKGTQTCHVGAGYPLLKFIHALNRQALSGMERMAGIPGTVGGAIYGCAGAYGQEIKDRLEKIKIFNGKKIHWITKQQCRFGYRTSILKKRKSWIILEAEFKLIKTNAKTLQKISRDTIKLRAKKYPPHLKCPGSFFKNIVIKNIKPLSIKKAFLKKIDPQYIKHGKLASGYLLDQIGAKGITVGGIAVAEYHGNLIYNKGGGKSTDIKKLADLLKKRVQKKFGITLEEEVQYL